MNLLFSCIGRREYIADFFRAELSAGDTIIGTGNSPWTPGFVSCDEVVLLPDIDDPSYIDAVLEVCRAKRVDALLSFSDPDVHRLSRAVGELTELGVVPLLPGPDVADIVFDKVRTCEFLVANGYSTPRTWLDPNEVPSPVYPMFVKPRRGSGSTHTYLVNSDDQLRVLHGYAPDMIVQEAIIGEEINLEICGDLAGKPVGVSLWRKYRSRLGETEQAETFREPSLIEFGLGLAERLGVVGPMDVDLIRRDGEVFVLEFNARFGGGYPVSHLAGADFPKLLLSIVSTGIATPNYDYRPGVVMMKRLDVIGGDSGRFFEELVRTPR